MRIPCRCGYMILDRTDAEPTKAHLVVDEDSNYLFERVQERSIQPLASGQITASQAMIQASIAIQSRERLVYQCPECGRLILFSGIDLEKAVFFVPDGPDVPKDVLRSNAPNG